MAAAPKVFQFKLVLLGDSAVGKSSLVLRFVRGQFFEYQESTIGGKERPIDLPRSSAGPATLARLWFRVGRGRASGRASWGEQCWVYAAVLLRRR
eukprot:COSAG02_NODE_17_length_55377_cov_106.402258_45_plen_95_part_00